MKKFSSIAFLIMLLAACSPSENTIQTAIAQTQASQPTITLTETQVPPTLTATRTPRPPTITPTRTRYPTNIAPAEQTATIQAYRDGFIEIVKNDLIRNIDMKELTMIRADDGLLEIEFITLWASRDNQPMESYNMIRFLAQDIDPSQVSQRDLAYITGGAGLFRISITSMSVDGNYRYHSLTDYDTLKDIHDQAISYDEWVAAAQAGFE